MGDASYDFSGRRVLVTGATRGLGLALARAFAQSGASVTITGTESLISAYDAPLGQFRYERLDLADHDSIVRVADQVGALDVLVNAAGARVSRSASVHEREFVSHSVRLGLVGPVALASRLRHTLRKSTMRGGGAVVNTQSLRSWFELSHGGSHAHTHMLDTTARLAVEWGRVGIRVNTVSATVLVPRQSQFRVEIERHSGPLLTRTRAQRTGSQQDVASAVMFLASTGAAYITGQTLIVNGGAGGARIGQ